MNRLNFNLSVQIYAVSPKKLCLAFSIYTYWKLLCSNVLVPKTSLFYTCLFSFYFILFYYPFRLSFRLCCWFCVLWNSKAGIFFSFNSLKTSPTLFLYYCCSYKQITANMITMEIMLPLHLVFVCGNRFYFQTVQLTKADYRGLTNWTSS